MNTQYFYGFSCILKLDPKKLKRSGNDTRMLCTHVTVATAMYVWILKQKINQLTHMWKTGQKDWH